MYRDEHNEDDMYYVCRFTPGGDTDDDYRRHLAGMIRSSKKGVGRGRRVAVMIIQDPGYPPPNAQVRQQVAEMSDDPDFDSLTAIVSENPMIRAVVTALNWMRNKRNDERIFPNTAVAMTWLEQARGEKLRTMRDAVNRLTR